jgi:hypothetical protein
MSTEKQVDRMLRDAGFELARDNRHRVYKRGADTITVARSPRSGENQVAWVRQEIRRRERAA